MTLPRRGPRTDRAMARGGSPGLRIAVAVLVTSAALALPTGARAQSVDGLQRQLVEIEGDLSALTRDQLSHTAVRSPTYVEERLTDGELFYRLQDYLRASIIFTDIVDNHANHTAYSDALFLLGDSLFRAGDYLGARSRFRQVLDHASEARFRPYVQRALGRLIEIAIHIRDFDGVDQYFQTLSRLPPTEVEATTAYFRAKYLYSRAVPLEEQLGDVAEGEASQIDLGRLEEARVAFEAVPQGSPYYPQARYFIGVVHTLRAEFPQAIEAFRRVLRSEATTPEAQKVVDLTHLALGRLYYETDQLDQASEAYQAVPRTSPHFDDALYEIAWVYIRLGDATRAERALEVLSVAAPDSQHIPDGKILRGNLLLRNGRFEDATQVFREVRNEFGPVFRDLEEVRESHADLHAHFRTLVRANLESFDVNTFLPETARRWVDLEGDFERAVGALSDLSQARRLVAETTDLITRLNAAISAPNRVSIFADLRRHREGTTALRNRLTQVRRRALQIEGSSGGSGELAEVRAQRRRIERTLGGMPTSEDDFIVRDDQLLNRYRQLERELSNLEVELLGIDARIVATRRFLDDTEDDQTSDTSAVRAELEQQERAVANYRAQIDEIERLLEIARIQVGVGDARYARDDRLRDEYNRLVARERELGGGSSRTNALFSRIARIESDIESHDRLIDSRVEERVADMRRVIAEESEKMVGYRETLTTLEDETEDVVGAITYTSFTQVRDRFYDLVLRADVGRIDVTWAQREEHRMRVDMLTRERSREIQALDDEFRDIMDDGQGGDDE